MMAANRTPARIHATTRRREQILPSWLTRCIGILAQQRVRKLDLTCAHLQIPRMHALGFVQLELQRIAQ